VGKIRWTERAKSDLKAIRDYIAADNPRVALRVAARIVAATERLSDFGLSGRVVPEHQGADVRELIVRPYRIAYRSVGDEVRILKIHHSARMLQLSDIEERPGE
jgi:addiction module RelE/StbE family toxin